MIGVSITSDNQMVFSLTFNGTKETEMKYFLKLKKILKSDIGVISYFVLAEFENGQDFKNKYK